VRLFGKKKDFEEKYAGLEALYKAHQQEWKHLVEVVLDRYMATIHEPGGMQQAKQQADFAEFGMKRTFLDALDEIRYEVESQAIFAEQANPRSGGAAGTALGQALIHWQVTGVQRRPLLGIPPSGEQVEIGGFSYMIIKNDAVRSDWTYWELPALTRRMAAAA